MLEMTGIILWPTKMGGRNWDLFSLYTHDRFTSLFLDRKDVVPVRFFNRKRPHLNNSAINFPLELGAIYTTKYRFQ